ncbi:hypothetical protein JCM19237_5713 [Photobacterium aphoticum]|uniref:Uncharacterized protein n=1 Tax=Photobacterium aphoticum TaxID=754436 RepID=A0A090QI45_9GAMM|nr:hypothetical protein JCM19237_5713 [Photobacterium aphoticum]
MTVCARGDTPNELPQSVERRIADRHDLHAVAQSLENGRWDVCIDMSGYLPIHVRQTAILLRDRVAHYIYISAVKAFEPPTPHQGL